MFWPFILLFFIVLPVVIAFLNWKLNRRKKSSFSRWWLLFYSVWNVFFSLIILLELFVCIFSDQMITSSGDYTYRQHWLSVITGYILITVLFVLSRSVLKKETRMKLVLATSCFICSFFIFIKNQHMIVYGSNGGRLIEFFTPFYINEHIGCIVTDYPDPNVELGGPFHNKNITMIHTRDNKILFIRPLNENYFITKQVLFWRFDFPDEMF